MRLISLLRGVNVSGANKIKMADLKAALNALPDFDQVNTYIQSGNLVFESELAEETASTQINACIKTRFGYDVPVLTLTPARLSEINEGNPYRAQEKCYFVFMFTEPSSESLANLRQVSYPGEHYTVANGVIYFYPEAGYGKAKLNNNLFENKLKIEATTRNLRTVETLLKLSN